MEIAGKGKFVCLWAFLYTKNWLMIWFSDRLGGTVSNVEADAGQWDDDKLFDALLCSGVSDRANVGVRNMEEVGSWGFADIRLDELCGVVEHWWVYPKSFVVDTYYTARCRQMLLRNDRCPKQK